MFFNDKRNDFALDINCRVDLKKKLIGGGQSYTYLYMDMRMSEGAADLLFLIYFFFSDLERNCASDAKN